jgi:hypothetical protein
MKSWNTLLALMVFVLSVHSIESATSDSLRSQIQRLPLMNPIVQSNGIAGAPRSADVSPLILERDDNEKRTMAQFASLLCPLNRQGCGVRKNEPSTFPVENALSYASSERDLPWQVSIRVEIPKSSAKWFCSGVIIREEWILTHAFCLYQETPGDLSSKSISVLPGTSNPFTNESLSVRASKYFIHEQFAGYPSEYDIALIKLKRKLNVAASGPLRMICLPENEDLDSGVGRISGWPHFNINHLVWSTGVSAPIKNCLTGDIKNKTSLMCVSSQGPPDCGMDLGSPFTRPRSDGAHVLIGIKSQDGKCRKSSDSPLVSRYVRVSQFLAWIAEKLSACPRVQNREHSSSTKDQKMVTAASLGLLSPSHHENDKN